VLGMDESLPRRDRTFSRVRFSLPLQGDVNQGPNGPRTRADTQKRPEHAGFRRVIHSPVRAAAGTSSETDDVPARGRRRAGGHLGLGTPRALRTTHWRGDSVVVIGFRGSAGAMEREGILQTKQAGAGRDSDAGVAFGHDFVRQGPPAHRI
jgi:hypothetical protein